MSATKFMRGRETVTRKAHNLEIAGCNSSPAQPFQPAGSLPERLSREKGGLVADNHGPSNDWTVTRENRPLVTR